VSFGDLILATAVLAEICNIITLGIITLPLTLRLYHLAGQNASTVKMLNCCAVGVVAIVFIPMITISSILNSPQSLLRMTSPDSLIAVSRKLLTAYYFLYLVATVVGSVIILLILIKAKQDTALSIVCISAPDLHNQSNQRS